MILLHRLETRNFKQLTDLSLHFPDNGSILIEGNNEAGKSSIFEAVYFALYGQHLMGDRDYKLEELRSFDADEMRVELEFSIDAQPFTITRRMGQKQTAKLLCPPGQTGERESITIVNEIKRRLDEEMRLSAPALLNTCFVEQKKLDRLELLNTQSRKETINELLNLRVLTVLEGEFKITREETSGLQNLKGRLEIARLDDELPALQDRQRSARSCWLYVQLTDLQDTWQALQRDVEAAADRLDEIQRLRDAITKSLEAAARLWERLGAIRTGLHLRARRWEEAAAAEDESRHRVEELQRLAKGLPNRLQQYGTWTGLLDGLASLERLQQEAAQLEGALAARKTGLGEWDQIHTERERDGARLADLQRLKVEQQGNLQTAAAALQERAQGRERHNRLALFVNDVTNYETLEKELTNLALARSRAEEQARRAVELRSELTQYQEAAARLRRSEQQRGEQQRLEERASVLQSRLLRREQIEAQIRLYTPRVETASAAEKAAAATLRDAETRAILLDWAEAVEHSAEGAGSLTPEWNRTAAEALLQRASRRADAAGRQKTIGFSLLAAGIVLGGVMVMSHLWPLAVLALLLLGGGAAAAMNGGRSAAAALAQKEEARTELAALEGERRALQRQAAATSTYGEHWREREESSRAALHELGVDRPSGAPEARTHAANLPALPVENAREDHYRAQLALQKELTLLDAAFHSLRSEEDAIAPQDWKDLEGEFAAARLALMNDIAPHNDPPQPTLNKGGSGWVAVPGAKDWSGGVSGSGTAEGDVLPDLPAIETAIEAVRSALAAAEADANRLASLEAQESAKGPEVQAVLQQLRTLHEQLSLPGDNPVGWKESALARRAALEAAVASTPDSLLEETVEKARGALWETERQIVALEGLQAQRTAQLEARFRPALQDEMETLGASLARNAEERTPLLEIPATLKAAQFPTASADLQARLASLRTALDRDREEAEKLPRFLDELESRTEGVEQQAAEFAREWKAALPRAEPPASATAALALLPPLEEHASQELAALDEPGLQGEDRALRDESLQLQTQTGTWKSQQDEIRKQQESLLCALDAPASSDCMERQIASLVHEGFNAPEFIAGPQPPILGAMNSGSNPADLGPPVLVVGQSSFDQNDLALTPQPGPGPRFAPPPLPKTGEGEKKNRRSRLDSLRVHAGAHDAAGWEIILRETEGAVRKNRSDRQAAARVWDVKEDHLSLQEAREAYAGEEKRLEVRRRSGIAIAKTRQSIVNRVMPLTLQNMRQLLPLLTEGRYADAEWDEATNTLSVFDSRAGSFQRKRIFSGGARDQISLALRLAFALATLPGEHNVRPGWLFLDEPLSSFDRQRTQALVDLITRGLIRREFAQILLVSHSDSFDPAQFDYRLRIERGAIVESTLPS